MTPRARHASGAGEALPRFVRSLNEFYGLVAKSRITVGILLNGGFRSTHTFELLKGKVVDYSDVDDSVTEYSRSEFETTIYAKAIGLRAMVLEEVGL